MNAGSPQEPLTRDGSEAVVATISKEIVRIYAEYFSRGPSGAKTIWSEDTVVCVLADVFTRAEQVLSDGGRFAEVRARRQAFQDEMEPLFRAVIEAATDRPVRSSLTQVSADGAAVHVYILGPDRRP